MNRFLAVALVAGLSPAAAAQSVVHREPLAAVETPTSGDAKALAAKMEAERPLFPLLMKEGHYAISVQKGQLDRPYLLTGTISKGLGVGVNTGADEGSFLFKFHRAGDLVEILRVNTGYSAAPGTPEAIGVATSFPDSPIAAVKIATENATAGFMVLPMDDFFLSDPTDVRATLAGNFGIPKEAFKPVAGVTRISTAAVFHSNMSVDADFVFAPQAPVRADALPDSRYLPVSVHYDITQPPSADGFDQRRADPRVGYFTSNHLDFSDPALKNTQNPTVALINHWRLEKVDPSAPISDVKKPIVWWIDPATPTQYRDAVRAGVLAWNAAFEAAGFRNALVVKDADKDLTPEQRASFNPSDAAYNVVHWAMDPKAGFSVGPSRANPLTGEIYSASVMLSDQMSRLWDILYHPELASRIDEDVRPDPARLAELAAQGITEGEKQKVLQDYITNVVVHEIGHTLGLRHNFKGSKAIALADEGKDGLNSSSIMDYVPMNIPAIGATGDAKEYFQTKPGPYDAWAIRYGYGATPSDPAAKAAALKAIARQGDANPTLAYGTDEDAQGIDPDVQRFDYGDDPIKNSTQMVARAQALWSRGAAAATPEGAPPAYASLNGGFLMYRYAVANVLPIIGGVRSDRRPLDEGGPRLRPVPADEQRAAVDFLAKKVLAAGSVSVPPELALRAAPDPETVGAGNALVDLPGATLSFQRAALDKIYSASTLRRLATDEQIEPKTAYRIAELFATTRDAVWSELNGTGKVATSASRRQLQRLHVQELTAVATSASVPEDAATLARAELTRIARDAKAAEARAANPLTKAHLAEMAREAGKLDARDAAGAGV